MQYWFSLDGVCSKIICQKRGRTQSVMFHFCQRYSNLRITNVLSLDSFETYQFPVLFYFVLWSTQCKKFLKTKEKRQQKRNLLIFRKLFFLSKVFKKIFHCEGAALTFWKIFNLVITNVLWIRPLKFQRFTRTGFIFVELQLCNSNENEQRYRYFSNINFTKIIWCKIKVDILEGEVFLFCFCMVSVCVCVFIFFHQKGSWLNKTKVLSEFKSTMVCWRKCICMKYLFWHIKDNHRKNLQASNCAKECQWNWAKPPEVKDNTYNTF